MRITNRTVSHSSGIEGPRYDPYGYEEYAVSEEYENGTSLKFVAHFGMSDWSKMYVHARTWESWCNLEIAHPEWQRFWKMIGKAYDRLHAMPTRCKECQTRLEVSSGYVGEDILYCPEGHGIFWENAANAWEKVSVVVYTANVCASAVLYGAHEVARK